MLFTVVVRTPPVPGAVLQLAARVSLATLGLAALVACGNGAEAPTALEPADALTPAAESGASGAARMNDGNQLLPDDEAPVGASCAARVAAETFTSASCSCEDTNIAGYLRTRSFRANTGPNAPELLGGSVGVNRDYITAGYADVGGSFAVAGTRDVRFAGFLKSGEDLRFEPAFDVAGVVDVARDAFLADTVRAFGRVGIGRDLHMPEAAGFGGIALVDVGGTQHTEAVSIAPPCACAPQQLIDVAALVRGAETDNDNDKLGLQPSDFELVVGVGRELSLPSGRYYLNQIAGVGALTLHVTGKTALFINDDLLATGLFRVDLSDTAELDIFVRDNLVITGAARFGDPARPSATRLYVGGTGDISIAGASDFVGNLYAPTANVLVGGVGRISGSLFAKNIVAAGFLSVGYDLSIQEGGQDCPPLVEGVIPRIR
jgi:hypothetical protein